MSRPYRRLLFLAVAATLCAAAPFGAAAEPADPGAAVDASVRPGDDFYAYANGPWLKSAAIPEGQSSWGTGSILQARTAARVREIIQGGASRKVSDYYASLFDAAAIEARGMAPVAGELAAIGAIKDRRALAARLGAAVNSEVDGVTANADHVLGIWVNQGFDGADRNWAHLWQGGLGMADRETYFDPSAASAALRERYRAHIAAVLNEAGLADADARATRVLALEVAIARSHAPDADAADVFKQNNSWKRADFAAKAPGMDWEAWFAAAGLERQPAVLVWQPSAVTGLAALVGAEDLETWKDYLRLRLIDHYALVLPKAVADEHRAYFGGSADREAIALAATTGALGHAVSRLYMQRWFPPAAKAKAKEMGDGLIAAWRGRIEHAAWMSPPTRDKALAKLAAFELELGYPDVWIDDRALTVARGDALGNLRRVEAFNRARNLERLGRPVDPVDWPFNPYAAAANILFSPNDEMFGAGILQPPYFDPDGDAASNYGSAGAGMAHEIGHSFDELGNIYGAHGELGDWWTPEDRTHYRAQAARVAAQAAAWCPLPGACLKGEQVKGESTNDLAGLVVAHDAYVASLKGRPDVVIDGLSGEQRFFIAFARRWRKLQTEAALRRQIAGDTHPPGPFRSDAVRNLDAWYAAFDVKPGDRLYLKPEDRVGVW